MTTTEGPQSHPGRTTPFPLNQLTITKTYSLPKKLCETPPELSYHLWALKVTYFYNNTTSQVTEDSHTCTHFELFN